MGFPDSAVPKPITKEKRSELLHESCRVLGEAMKQGEIGDSVTAIQHLILTYYEDVRGQADESFKSAKRVATFGFIVLVFTIVYVMAMDFLPHIYPTKFQPNNVGAVVETGKTGIEEKTGVEKEKTGVETEKTAVGTGAIGVGTIGLIGSGLVEFIAGLQFVLYGRATRQFGAFHICLERTHRYLLAYEMTQQMDGDKDQTVEKIVCIMANAPMITREDIDRSTSGKVAPAPTIRQADTPV
jgi:hypothetical protein